MDINTLALQNARHRKGLKQEDLAKLVGCSRNSVIAAEKGRCSSKMLARLAAVLGQEVEKFVIERPKRARLDRALTPLQEHLWEVVQGLGDDTAALVLAYTRGFVDGLGYRFPPP